MSHYYNTIDDEYLRERRLTLGEPFTQTEDWSASTAERYQLGTSKSGKCIYWMIDEQGSVRDGHIGDAWASTMLKQRAPKLMEAWHPQHCLFGQHLLSEGANDRPVCIVEKERSAVILSELFPDFLWMASVYPANLHLRAFEPLRGREVMLYPSTDLTMSNYVAWLELAVQVRETYHLHITVNDILEQYATPEQKAAEIDLVDFLYPANHRLTTCNPITNDPQTLSL